MKTIILGVLLLFTATAQAAEERSWWQFWRSTADKTVEASNGLFTNKEKEIIRSFLREHRESRYGDDDAGSGRDKPKKKKKLPPGLKKKLERGGELPPGWQKKVARGEVLDADLYGHSRPLPKELLKRLSSKQGTELRLLDDRVVRIMDGTRAVLDILQVE